MQSARPPTVDLSLPVLEATSAAERLAAEGEAVQVDREALHARGLEFLAEASKLLASSPDYATTIARLAQLTVPPLADYCFVDVLEDSGDVRRAASEHKDPAKDAFMRTLEPSRHPRIGRVARVWGRGEALLVADARADQGHEDDEGHQALLTLLEPCSYMLVPLVAGGHRFGVMGLFATQPGRRYRPVDLALATVLADRAALAVYYARLYENLERAVHARDDLLAIVTHDLRNPLAAIAMGAALVLKAAPTADPETRAQLKKSGEVIRRSARTMDTLIGDLLDLATIESGRLRIEKKAHKVGEIVHDVVEMFAAVAEEKAIRLGAHVEARGEVVCDRDRILQVLSNLIGNAVKFTPERGAITVRVLSPRPGVVELSVSDTGPGVPPENREKMFDAYWQAIGGKRQGVGLGLAIAKGLVEAHGGSIGVRSAEGSGTTVWFTLPALAAT